MANGRRAVTAWWRSRGGVTVDAAPRHTDCCVSAKHRSHRLEESRGGQFSGPIVIKGSCAVEGNGNHVIAAPECVSFFTTHAGRHCGICRRPDDVLRQTIAVLSLLNPTGQRP